MKSLMMNKSFTIEQVRENPAEFDKEMNEFFESCQHGNWLLTTNTTPETITFVARRESPINRMTGSATVAFLCLLALFTGSLIEVLGK